MSSNDERFAGSNPEAPHGIEQRELDQTVLCEQITKRAKIAMGWDQLSELDYGIVVGTDPATPATGSALAISQNLANALRFDVSPGRAATQSGFLIEVEVVMDDRSLASSVVGAENVVFLEYATQETTDPSKLAVTRAGTVAGVEFEVLSATSLIKVDLLSNYIDSGIYSDNAKLNHVVLAVIKVTEDEFAVRSLVIDHSKATHSWNRPWFSHVDVKHRTKIGSGTVTDNNPHGIGLSDIGQGDMTLLQALVRTGTVLSKDYDVDRIPGFLCKETIPAVRRLIDDANGSVTGVPLAIYVELEDIPIHLGRSRDATQPRPAGRRAPDFYDYCPWLVKGTNKLVFHPGEVIGAEDIEVWYTCAGGSMKTGAVTDILTIAQLDNSREWCISGGQALTAFTTTALDLRSYRPYPYVLRAFAKSDGEVISLPQVAQCNYLLSDAPGGFIEADVTFLGPSRLVVALTNSVTPPHANMLVEITLSGTDVGGNVINETVTFDSNWRDFLAPNVEGAMEDAALVTYMKVPTTQVFYSFAGWTLDKNSFTSKEASIGIFAHPDWRLSPDLRDLCCLGAILWDGLRVNSIKDFRRTRMTLHDASERVTQAEIASRISAFENGISGGSRTVTVGGGGGVLAAYDSPQHEILVEDFNRPRYHGLKMQAGSGNTSWAKLFDPASLGTGEVYDGVNVSHDRWSDGLGDLTFDYTSPGNGIPSYISRGMRFPGFGKLAPFNQYTGYMKIILVRHYLEDQGHLGGNNNHIGDGVGKRTIVNVRIGTNIIPNDDWSPWYSFNIDFDVLGKDINTFYLQTGLPSVEKIQKFQFQVLGGNLRALAFQFGEPEDLDKINQFEDIVFEVNAQYDDIAAAEGGGGFLTANVIKASSRIAVSYIGAMNNDSATQFMVQDPAQSFWFSGVYLMVFTFDGAPLANDDYQIIITPNTPAFNDDFPISRSISVQRGSWNYFQTAGGLGRVAIAINGDSDANTTALRYQSTGNWTDFTVTIRVPL